MEAARNPVLSPLSPSGDFVLSLTGECGDTWAFGH